MDSAINDLARQIVEVLPECWGDLVEDGQVTINLTVGEDILEELMQEVERLDMPHCRICGCTDYDPCPGGCEWVEEDLCSECVGIDRLQDAAPDMLEVIKEALALLGTHRPPWFLVEHLRKMIAVVEKATGISAEESPIKCPGSQQVDIYDLIGEAG